MDQLQVKEVKSIQENNVNLVNKLQEQLKELEELYYEQLKKEAENEIEYKNMEK